MPPREVLRQIGRLQLKARCAVEDMLGGEHRATDSRLSLIALHLPQIFAKLALTFLVQSVYS